MGVFGVTIAVPARAFLRSSSLMRVFLRSSSRLRLDDKIPAQKNERNFARLRTRMMCVQKVRAFTIQRDLSPFSFQLSISDLSFLTFHLSIVDLSFLRFHFLRFHFLRFHFSVGGFSFGRFRSSSRGFNSMRFQFSSRGFRS